MEPSESEESLDNEVIGPPETDLLELPDMPDDSFPKEVKKEFRQIRELLKTNKDARACAQALLDAYQLQQWAMYAMEKLGVSHKSVGVTLAYVKLKALARFKEEPLRNSLRDSTLPFMSERMLEHLDMLEKGNTG